MAKRILSKEEFVYMVMEEQNMKKELGIKLTKFDDNEFNEMLAEIWLEYGCVKKKVVNTAKTVKKEVTKKANVVEVAKKVTEVVKDVATKTELVKEKVISKVEEMKAEVKPKTKKSMISETISKVETKVEEIKSEIKKEEKVFKTKDIRRKDGLMQLAFDF